jgi:hypothetical protein
MLALPEVFRTFMSVTTPTPPTLSTKLTATRGERDLSAFPGLTADESAGIQEPAQGRYGVWRYLANRQGQKVCRKCLNEGLRAAGLNLDQIARQLKDLRDLGYSIPTGTVACSKHGQNSYAGQLTAIAPLADASRVRWDYTAKERKKMLETCGNKDAFDGAEGSLELDHRVPMIRSTADEERIDPDDADKVQQTIMCLTRQHNLKKSRACESCVETEIRPVPPIGIVHWFEGDENYDEVIGCNGCFFAYPERWKASLNERLSASSPLAEPQALGWLREQ